MRRDPVTEGVKRTGRVGLWVLFPPLGLWRSVRHGKEASEDRLAQKIATATGTTQIDKIGTTKPKPMATSDKVGTTVAFIVVALLFIVMYFIGKLMGF